MRFNYIISIIITQLLINYLLSPVTYSQQKIVQDYIKKIDSLNFEFNNSLKKANLEYKDPLKAHIEAMDLNELKHIASLMYKAADLDYLAINDTGFKRLDILKKQRKRINENYTLIMTNYYFQEQFKKSISPVIYALTRVAYFLRIHVENEKMIIPEAEDLMHSEAHLVDAFIEDVYKGKGKYQVGNHIQFFYYESWHKKRTTFEAGKEYFVPLEPRGKYPKIDSLIVLVPYLDDSNGFYPVINSYITDKYNFFGFGEKIPYQFFEERLRTKIKELESW